MRHINPLELIGRELNSVQNPVRYLGGEYGICIKKDSDVDITFVIAFPDVYEIAMSNQAVKIIYNLIFIVGFIASLCFIFFLGYVFLQYSF